MLIVLYGVFFTFILWGVKKTIDYMMNSVDFVVEMIEDQKKKLDEALNHIREERSIISKEAVAYQKEYLKLKEDLASLKQKEQPHERNRRHARYDTKHAPKTQENGSNS